MNINDQLTNEELIKILTSPDTDEETYQKAAAENRRRLLAEKQQQEALNTKIRDVVAAVRGLNISFSDFMKSVDQDGHPPFSTKEIKQFALNQGWLKDSDAKEPSGEKSEKADKPVVIVGTFKLSDYGFVMPTKSQSGEPFSTDTEFVWDINSFYPPRTWQYKFIQVLKEKGFDDIQKHLTPEFKAWLEEATIPAKGPQANKPIYYNKRKFYAVFGMNEDMTPITK